MSKLIYPINMSLDGYMEDVEGNLDWSTSDDEIFTFWTDFERSIGTYLYGRSMYESMVYWETESPYTPSNFTSGDPSTLLSEFVRIWQNAEKIIYSRTLKKVTSAKTKIEHEFNPETIKSLKNTSPANLTIGGPNLAQQAIEMGLVDECYLLVHPVILGGGKKAFPDNLHIQLELLNQKRFESEVVFLHYRLIV